MAEEEEFGIYETDFSGVYAQAVADAMAGKGGEPDILQAYVAPVPGLLTQVETIFKPGVGTLNPKTFITPSPIAIGVVVAFQVAQLVGLAKNPQPQIGAWAQETADIAVMWQKAMDPVLKAQEKGIDDPLPLPKLRSQKTGQPNTPKAPFAPSGGRKPARAIVGYSRCAK